MLNKKILLFSQEHVDSNLIDFFSKNEYKFSSISDLSFLYKKFSDSISDVIIIDCDIVENKNIEVIFEFIKHTFGEEFPIVVLYKESGKKLQTKYKKIYYLEKEQFLQEIIALLNEIFTVKKTIYNLSNNMIYLLDEHELYDTNDTIINLTKQETLLVEFLLKNSSGYQSYEVLMNELSGHFECSLETLRTVVKNIRKKTTNTLILNRSGFGYKINLFSQKQKEMINVLLVDDQKTNIEFLNILLNKHFSDICIFKALGGKEAMNILKKETIHIVLLDIEMPEVDGWEVARYIKQALYEKHIAVIFITSVYLNDRFKQEGYELGAVDYITKPVDRNLLINRLKLYIKSFKQEQKILEQIAYKAEQEKKLLQKEVMLAQSNILEKIAHHWRQPLSSISANAGMISIGLENEVEKTILIRSAEEISSMTLALSQIISQFQTFFKPQNDKESFNIQKTIESIVQLMRFSFSQNNIKLQLEMEPFEFYGYENEFKQVIISLLNNCIDILSTKEMQKRFIKIEGYKKDDEIRLSVMDNGGGISKDIEYKIFEPYFTTKHEYSGTGLSLYLSKEIVQRHLGGSLEYKTIQTQYENKNYDCAQFLLILKQEKEIEK